MKDEEVQYLIDLRKFIIDQYNSLDGRTSPSTAVMRQADAAYIYEELIKRMDKLLSEYVTFQ